MAGCASFDCSCLCVITQAAILHNPRFQEAHRKCTSAGRKLCVELQIVVALRGTDSSLEDKLTDARIRQVNFQAPGTTEAPARSGFLQRLRFLIPFRAPSSQVRVHRGFYAAARSVLPRLQELLAMCVGADEGWTVHLTGHSLGAAVAMLIAYELKLDDRWCAFAPLFRRCLSSKPGQPDCAQSLL